MRIEERTCTRCGEKYVPYALRQKYCDRCRPIVYEEQRVARYERYRQKVLEQRRAQVETQRKMEYADAYREYCADECTG